MVKVRHRLGKYRIERKFASGGFASVYKAYDTVECIHVALKIPHAHLVTREAVQQFKKEIRTTASLDHPNILQIKTAEFIEGHLVVVYALGKYTLTDFITRRHTDAASLEMIEQMFAAVAYAHERDVIHCDIKPDNFILFPEGKLRLADFGIAKVAIHTLSASGSGTVGYMAPEQAMGKPSKRSDVFSLGLIAYEIFAGELPEWPFVWPPEGYYVAEKKLHTDFLGMIRRCIEVDQHKRYDDAMQLYAAFKRIRPHALLNSSASRRKKPKRRKAPTQDWKQLRFRSFKRLYGKALEISQTCEKCHGPVAESMSACPWCGQERKNYTAESSFPARCSRCGRGKKLDWRFCAWCYGESSEPTSGREYSDLRYTAKCHNPTCTRKALMPYMRYCPWCRTKVRKKWKLPDCKETCDHCHWGVARDFWDFCPWCGKSLKA